LAYGTAAGRVRTVRYRQFQPILMRHADSHTERLACQRRKRSLPACEHASARGAQQYAFLGDLVGYGADPAWVVDTIMTYAQRAPSVVYGNHDQAVAHQIDNQMNPSHYWPWRGRAPTQSCTTRFSRQFAAQCGASRLPYVHASAANPLHWNTSRHARCRPKHACDALQNHLLRPCP